MRLSFSFKVTAAICVELISMVGLGAFGYLSIGELIDTGREERRRMEVLPHVEAIRLNPSRSTSS
jgi:CHASE3 domain sensor protein